MYDPMTVAFEIKYPWWKHKPWPKRYRHSRDKKWDWQHGLTESQRRGRDPFWDEGYRTTFITIWHKDPERGGNDDSCGFSFAGLTNWQKERLHNAAWSEGEHRHFLRGEDKEWTGSLRDAESLDLGMVLLVDRVLKLGLPFNQLQRHSLERIHHADCCPAANLFCFLPGYHTNNRKDSNRGRQEHFYNILCGVARGLIKRPWYRCPRWHVWHWRFQVHPLQDIWHWLFRRCSKCGKGFAWKECAIGDWNGTRHWHDRCDTTACVNLQGTNSPDIPSAL